MPTRPLTRAVQELRAAVAEPDAPVPTDAELLGRFVEQGDEAAFAILVGRHGSLVWGVCRRALGHHDSEDAYQATFLVLARKAATIRPRDALPNWLHGVARRTALAARADVAKRHSRECQPEVLPEPPALSVVPPDDALDQELARLPEMYRVAVILCDLEGRTGKEAAGLLSVPEGTLSTRLRTGRRMLADRLARRGLARRDARRRRRADDVRRVRDGGRPGGPGGARPRRGPGQAGGDRRGRRGRPAGRSRPRRRGLPRREARRRGGGRVT